MNLVSTTTDLSSQMTFPQRRKIRWMFIGALLTACVRTSFGAEEHPVKFIPAVKHALTGDYQSEEAKAALVFLSEPDTIRVHIFDAFDQPEAQPDATLEGKLTDNKSDLTGKDWTGTLSTEGLKTTHAGRSVSFRRVERVAST